VPEYVLDSSALLAYLYDEEGADQTEEIVFSGEAVLIPFAALMEVEYKVLQEMPWRLPESLATLKSWPVQIVESDPEWRSVAASVKATGKVSFADSWMAGLTLLRDAVLVHKDPEFDAIDDMKVVRLPYKQRGFRR
jgi:predicted nucleic acid-binding protein